MPEIKRHIRNASLRYIHSWLSERYDTRINVLEHRYVSDVVLIENEVIIYPRRSRRGKKKEYYVSIKMLEDRVCIKCSSLFHAAMIYWSRKEITLFSILCIHVIWGGYLTLIDVFPAFLPGSIATFLAITIPIIVVKLLHHAFSLDYVSMAYLCVEEPDFFVQLESQLKRRGIKTRRR